MKKLYFLLIALCFFNHLQSQIINFPDPKFKWWLLLTSYGATIASDDNGNYIKIDANNDGEIEMSEISNITSLYLASTDFLSIEGISNFKSLKNLTIKESKMTSINLRDLPNLIKFTCDKNKELLSLEIHGLSNLENLAFTNNLNLSSFNYSGLSKLKEINGAYNKFTSYDFTNLTELERIICTNNELKSLKVSNLSKLKELYFDDNQIETIDFSGLINLEILSFSRNLIRTLNLQDLSNLDGLYCLENKIESLDLSKLKKLSALNCRNNQLLTLDISSNTKLNIVDCSYNKLTSLFFKNGLEMGWNVNLDHNPNLKYVCIEEGKRNFDVFIGNAIDHAVDIGDKSKIVVNSYCSFLSGGDNYEMKGNARFDSDNNGCDLSDFSYPNFQLRVVSAKNVTEKFISNLFGNYSISLTPGDYSVVPVIENPSYFLVSPSQFNVSFPSQTSPSIQNFCLTSVGNHSDLEITLLPISSAVPGFDSTYKIVFKNKGNKVKSGSVNLNFNSKILNYVFSNTTTSNQNGDQITWDFINLRPFESKEITLTLKLNKPTEIPAVNNGDILKFTAIISSPDMDETPFDNTFTLNQTVVGSYDPNDKTCLEGTVITPSLIGEYVHYMIRFENTGTYQAQNIVVKDMIDLSKFDISTLIPTSSSHSFVTKISEGNKVEFIFENINLPFDDATNDGYIAFKIKTKPTLVVGDSFTNDANIYFDYNFPILTNKATSTFKTVLSTEDFNFSRYLNLYPNPASQVLNISQNDSIEIQSFEIYDILGQLVIAVPNAKTTSNIDISKLRTGNYFIKVKSDKGSSSMKFIKN
ncbi:MAG: T9SS type A sorting domain-containing protein [Flavobacterium sp.]|nr:T9SS type A sorting domain-containing protein [Flavobacterium sp.]